LGTPTDSTRPETALGGRENRQLVLDTVKDGASIVNDTALGMPYVGVLFLLLRLLNKALEVGRDRYAICDVLAENLQELVPEKLRRNPDLDFLSKVSRVGVALKTNRVS
jgi:hypothetical protein